MSAFDDDIFHDPFEDIVRNFFGGQRRIRKQRSDFIEGEEEERTIDLVEDKNYIYLIFEFPGYNEKDITISVNERELNITASKSKEKSGSENVQEYLKEKLYEGITIRKVLPKQVDPKNFKSVIKNGILEVIFSKK